MVSVLRSRSRRNWMRSDFVRWPCGGLERGATVFARQRESGPQSSDARHVLVVDDDRDCRELIAELLGGRGYAVDTAADGLSALEKMRCDPPDIVVLDWMMPRMSGGDLLAVMNTDRLL